MSYLSKLCKKLKKNSKCKRLHQGFSISHRIHGEYFVTTDIGIIHIHENKGRLLTSRPGYGIAIQGDDIYFSYENADLHKSGGASSFIIKGTTKELLNGEYFNHKKLKKRKTLYKQPFSSSNGRIHQIALDPKSNDLLVAASQENSIIVISDNGQKRRLSPFLDKFDVPILFDQNHINSVLPIEDVIYFLSYKAGGRSMICYMKNGQTFGWNAGATGYHDILPTHDGFLTCDTFGALGHGKIMNQDGEMLQKYFEEFDYAPRGAAGSRNEILIGHSHKGPRSKRFQGNGGLIVIEEKNKATYVELPASQVYQIVQKNGTQFIPIEKCNHNDFKQLLTKRFGNEIQIGPYAENVL